MFFVFACLCLCFSSQQDFQVIYQYGFLSVWAPLFRACFPRAALASLPMLVIILLFHCLNVYLCFVSTPCLSTVAPAQGQQRWSPGWRGASNPALSQSPKRFWSKRGPEPQIRLDEMAWLLLVVGCSSFTKCSLALAEICCIAPPVPIFTPLLKDARQGSKGHQQAAATV